MKKDADKAIDEFICAVHNLYLIDAKQEEACALALGLSSSAVYQARRKGKGTLKTHLKIFCWGVKIDPSHLIRYVPKLKKLSRAKSKIDHLEQLIASLLRYYPLDELIAMIQLLLDKYKVEEKLGLRKKPGRPKKSK